MMEESRKEISPFRCVPVEMTVNLRLKMTKILKMVLPAMLLVGLFVFLFFWNKVEIVPLIQNNTQQFEKAVVTKILQDNLQENGSRIGNQKVMVKFLTGPDKGKEVKAVSTNGSLYGATCKKGMKVITLTNKAGEVEITSVYSFDRTWIVAGFVLFLFALLILVGGKNGFKAVLGLAVTFIFIAFFLFPAIYRGINPVLAAVITVSLSTIITIYILGGYTAKSAGAILGTVSGVIIAGLCATIFSKIAHITGYNVSNIETLIFVSKYTQIQCGDLLFAGILISSLGAVMDVAFSISSAVTEIHKVDNSLGLKELFKHGMNIGRDMMGTMANTLILAFTGGTLSELVLDYAYDIPFLQLINSYAIGIEIIKGIAGSVGIILTVPLVAFFAAFLCGKKDGVKKQKKSDKEKL